jgi:hypothetical protein
LEQRNEDAYELLHGKNADVEIVSTPWQSELRYVALADDSVQDAVVAVQVRNLVLIAVAIPQDGKWDRIPSFKCICASNNTDDSYGSGNGGNLLGITLDIGRFERNDLKLRAIEFPQRDGQVTSFDQYVEHEAHSRIFGGALGRTISFEARTHFCVNFGGEIRCTGSQRSSISIRSWLVGSVRLRNTASSNASLDRK